MIRSHPSRVANPNRAIAGSAMAKIPRIMNNTARAIGLSPAFFTFVAVPPELRGRNSSRHRSLHTDPLGPLSSPSTLRLSMIDPFRLHIPSESEDLKDQDSIPVWVKFVPCHAMTG